MASTVTVDYNFDITVKEAFSQTEFPGATVGGGSTITNDAWNSTGQLMSSSTPPVTKQATFNTTLSSGTATIDLTSMTPAYGSAVNFTGLKVQVAHFINPTTNANAITIAEGASSGYELVGDAFKVVLDPGEEWIYKGLDTSPDVATDAKNIDVTGTGSQVLRVKLAAG